MVENKCIIISIHSCRFPGTQKYDLFNAEFSRCHAVSRLGYRPVAVRERSLGRSKTERERTTEKVGYHEALRNVSLDKNRLVEKMIYKQW